MSVTLEEIGKFAQFAAAKIGNGGADLTLEALVQQWYEQREIDETVADVQQGLKDIEDGKGLPLDVAFREIRSRLGSRD